MSYPSLTAISVVTFLGAGALSVGGVLGSYGARATAPEWFTLDSLTIEGNVVSQSRTIRVKALPAIYTAKVEDASGTSKCAGSGNWVYRPKVGAAVMTLDVWVNDEGCWNRLSEGERYTGIAEWTWNGPDGELRTETGDFTFVR